MDDIDKWLVVLKGLGLEKELENLYDGRWGHDGSLVASVMASCLPSGQVRAVYVNTGLVVCV